MATDTTRPHQPPAPDLHGKPTRLPAHGAQSHSRVTDTGRGLRTERALRQKPAPSVPHAGPDQAAGKRPGTGGDLA